MSDVQIKHGPSGHFDIYVDDKLALSKGQLGGRFPTDDEVAALAKA